MKFTFRVLWTNTIKNRQEWVDVSEQDIAIFIAKKKVRENMQNVLIQLNPEYGEDLDNPVIEVN